MRALRTIDQIEGVIAGHASDAKRLTGCTAVLFPGGAVAGADTAGVATGSRELAVLDPRHLVERIHGVCLCGGSAFGLAAVDGVMRRLAEEGIGHPTSAGPVPIVPGAVVYDLNLGDGKAYPDAEMGYRAADLALSGERAGSGNLGAGTGTSVGKLLGVGSATKTGVGQAGLVTNGGVQIGALVVLNAVGDVRDPQTGRLVAGARRRRSSLRLADSAAVIRAGDLSAPETVGDHNTTLVVLATNSRLSRVEAGWLAGQATVALARVIDPPFTRHDGDLVFCASTGDHDPGDLHRLALLGRDVVSEALLDACHSAVAAAGLPAAADLRAPAGR